MPSRSPFAGARRQKLCQLLVRFWALYDKNSANCWCGFGRCTTKTLPTWRRRWQNTILVSQNAILPPPSDDVAGAIAQRRVSKREAQYASEVRRLLDAGLAVMRDCGLASSPRVADIVTAAGLSNDAFYRHFASKEALVAAILEDGSLRLASYLRHQMEKASAPEDKVRRWIEGVMAQATDADAAATTRAVLWNGGSLTERVSEQRPSPAASLAMLLREPLSAIGSSDPDADATLVAHATIGLLSDFLWQRARPKRAQIEHVVRFCLGAVISK
jgi:AcrR family transcriptional regulator